MNEPIFATAAEYAVHRGVSVRMVGKYRAAGHLVLHEDGRIVVHASDARLARVLHPTKGGNRTTVVKSPKPAKTPREGDSLPRHTPAIEKIDLAAETARERRAKAALAELELAEKMRELVSRTQVEALVRGLAIAARETLLALPGRIAPELALMRDADELERKLVVELELVCKTLQGGVDDAVVLRGKGASDSLPPSDGVSDRDPISADDLLKPGATA